MTIQHLIKEYIREEYRDENIMITEVKDVKKSFHLEVSWTTDNGKSRKEKISSWDLIGFIHQRKP